MPLGQSRRVWWTTGPVPGPFHGRTRGKPSAWHANTPPLSVPSGHGGASSETGQKQPVLPPAHASARMRGSTRCTAKLVQSQGGAAVARSGPATARLVALSQPGRHAPSPVARDNLCGPAVRERAGVRLVLRRPRGSRFARPATIYVGGLPCFGVTTWMSPLPLALREHRADWRIERPFWSRACADTARPSLSLPGQECGKCGLARHVVGGAEALAPSRAVRPVCAGTRSTTRRAKRVGFARKAGPGLSTGHSGARTGDQSRGAPDASGLAGEASYAQSFNCRHAQISRLQRSPPREHQHPNQAPITKEPTREHHRHRQARPLRWPSRRTGLSA